MSFSSKGTLCLLIIAIAITAVGCGTIIHGTTQQVGVSSSPSGAEVVVDGVDQGSTPVTVDLSRKDKHTVKLSLDGYQPYEMIINRKVSGWVAGNIIFGGLIGLAVDAATGGMYKLSPEQVNAQLDQQATGQAIQTEERTIFITVVLQPDPEWQQIGSLTPSQSK